MTQRQWFKLHGWCSLPIWILFCFICITGTIAVFSHELTWLFNENARAVNPNDLAAQPISELVATVQNAYPSANITTVMTFEPYLINAVIFSTETIPSGIAYVNQYTGEIQEVNQGITFINFMRSLHGWLLFPWQSSYSVGYYLVSAMSFVMIGALVTGLVIYKRFWRAYTQPKIRAKQGKKTLLTDLHKHGGAWSIWFLIVMSLTGLWYFTQQVMWHADIDIEAHPPLVETSDIPLGEKAEPPVTFADAMKTTEERFPEFRPSYIMMPEHNRDMFKIIGGGDTVFFDDYSYRVNINPWTGEIASETTPETMGALQTIQHIVDPLHYGTIGGIWTKAIWFIFGLILSGMSITGFLIWGSRTVKAAKEKKTPLRESLQSEGAN
ncbi:PepSY-associated TM helix domain-containing protein [Idiomarina piscisalsi]|uniref:PepSY domain-containing protein n=1 Tax=Idiomarina piscisalsi TaxID=1096243 RepID=A0A432YM80_9GAMM|nr:PepSY-associated TM helix domain-containing protein [Idiomarina piscisalsi]RUO61998.1 PepSY domain-containing protein [Idiomarina piscisalsi]